MRLRTKVLVTAALEIAYAVFTRTWLRGHFDGAQLEVAITACRVATIAIYWGLFADLVRLRPRAVDSLRHPLLLVGIAIALAIPFLFLGSSPGGGLGTAVVFALTSVVVGFREELLYRAVLINLLQPRVGVAGALFGSTALFVIYHYGALPITWPAVTEVVCMSLLLGLIYLRSQSLLTAAAVHALYDGIWFFGPFLETPLPNGWRPVFLVSALGLVFLWWRRDAQRTSRIQAAASI